MTDQQGIRKAAVFLNGLDWETASTLLKRLPAEESRAIRREMVAIEGISSNEVNKTVSQFLNETKYDKKNKPGKSADMKSDGPQKTVFSGDGVDLFEFSGQAPEHMPMTHGPKVAANSATIQAEQKTDQTQAEPEAVSEPAEPRRFDYLERRSAFDTAAFLAEEGGQLIAVVLSQMTPRYSGDVLACFEQSLKRDLIRRLAKLNATDETILDEIDAVLKDRLKREVEERPKSKPGLALLERILQVVDNELGNEIGNDIISGLNEIDFEEQQAAAYAQYGDYDAYDEAYHDGMYVADVEPGWAFEDLGLLDDRELGTLFRSQDHEIVVQSLLLCDVYFIERVLGRFPVYEQVSLREMMRLATATADEEQDYARQCVMQGAMQLIEEGHIADIPLGAARPFVDSRSVVVDYSV